MKPSNFLYWLCVAVAAIVLFLILDAAIAEPYGPYAPDEIIHARILEHEEIRIDTDMRRIVMEEHIQPLIPTMTERIELLHPVGPIVDIIPEIKIAPISIRTKGEYYEP